MNSRISTSGWLSDVACWRVLVIQHGTDVLWASSGPVRQENWKDIRNTWSIDTCFNQLLRSTSTAALVNACSLLKQVDGCL
jgi:hypothetical protein